MGKSLLVPSIPPRGEGWTLKHVARMVVFSAAHFFRPGGTLSSGHPNPPFSRYPLISMSSDTSTIPRRPLPNEVTRSESNHRGTSKTSLKGSFLSGRWRMSGAPTVGVGSSSTSGAKIVRIFRPSRRVLNRDVLCSGSGVKKDRIGVRPERMAICTAESKGQHVGKLRGAISWDRATEATHC